MYEIVDVVEKKCKLRQALIKDKRFEQLFLLPAAQTRDKSAINEEQMKELTSKLKEEFDYIIIDEALENIEVKDIEQQVRKAELQFKELVYQVSDHEWTVIEY